MIGATCTYLHVSSQIYSYSSNSLYLLFIGWLAELPAILDRLFTGVANTTSTPIGWEGGGGQGAIKWWAKATFSLKQPNGIHALVPFSPPHITQSS